MVFVGMLNCQDFNKSFNILKMISSTKVCLITTVKTPKHNKTYATVGTHTHSNNKRAEVTVRSQLQSQHEYRITTQRQNKTKNKKAKSINIISI
jgi:hypothetical protein